MLDQGVYFERKESENVEMIRTTIISIAIQEACIPFVIEFGLEILSYIIISGNFVVVVVVGNFDLALIVRGGTLDLLMVGIVGHFGLIGKS